MLVCHCMAVYESDVRAEIESIVLYVKSLSE
jgi:bacterioferritin-associated ferredoxin